MPEPAASAPVPLYLCFEPDDEIYALRIDAGPRTNADLDAYRRRLETPEHVPGASPVKSALRAQIARARVFICIINQGTGRNRWIGWEIETAESLVPRPGLVGVLLHEHNRPPPALADSGAIFVPFRRTSIERAIEWALTEKFTSGDYTLLED